MVLNPQTIDLQHRCVNSVGMNIDQEFLRSSKQWAVLIRIMYVSFTILQPIQLAHASGLSIGMVVIEILFMGAIESLILATLFSLSHKFEHDAVVRHRESKRSSPSNLPFSTSNAETSNPHDDFLLS